MGAVEFDRDEPPPVSRAVAERLLSWATAADTEDGERASASAAPVTLPASATATKQRS